jgi:cation:H+ antiporter
MMIQATIPSALGLFFTPWLLQRSLILAGVVTLLAVMVLWMMFRRGNITPMRLAWASSLYVLFGVLLLLG